MRPKNHQKITDPIIPSSLRKTLLSCPNSSKFRNHGCFLAGLRWVNSLGAKRAELFCTTPVGYEMVWSKNKQGEETVAIGVFSVPPCSTQHKVEITGGKFTKSRILCPWSYGFSRFHPCFGVFRPSRKIPSGSARISTSHAGAPAFFATQAASGGRGLQMKRSEYYHIQLIGLREKLQENPIFRGKINGFL